MKHYSSEQYDHQELLFMCTQLGYGRLTTAQVHKEIILCDVCVFDHLCYELEGRLPIHLDMQMEEREGSQSHSRHTQSYPDNKRFHTKGFCPGLSERWSLASLVPRPPATAKVAWGRDYPPVTKHRLSKHNIMPQGKLSACKELF